MTETEANTQAIMTNTEWIIISTIVAIVIFIVGFIINKNRATNVIKNSKNKKGKISQSSGDNIIDNVDNEDGSIIQN